MSVIPVTVMVGSLGTDTSSVVSQFMKTDTSGRVTAIVPRKSGKRKRQKPAPGFVHTQEQMIRLGKGCSCCTVRADLMSKVKDIAAERSADHIVIQTGPVSDLTTLAKTFTVEDETGSVLSRLAHIQTMSMVVDGRQFMSSLEGHTGRALIERIEFTNVVIVTGHESMTPESVERLNAALTALNPEARIVQSYEGMNLSAVQSSTPFDLNAVKRRTSGRGPMPHSALSELVSRFKYQARRPFHPGRLHSLLAEPWEGVVRANGSFWVASQPHLACALDVAGTDRRTNADGQWWVTVPEEQRPASAALKQYLENIWDSDFGDRHHNISIVGVGVDEMALRARFDSCLLTDEELAEPESWVEFHHPFPWPATKR